MGSNPTLSAIATSTLGAKVMHLKRWAISAGALTVAGLTIESATRSGGHANRHGVRLGRLMYWPPWTVSDPWRPHVELAGDEHCNPSLLVVLPFLGALIVFYGRRWRTEADGPCPACLAEGAHDGMRYEGDGIWVRDHCPTCNDPYPPLHSSAAWSCTCGRATIPRLDSSAGRAPA